MKMTHEVYTHWENSSHWYGCVLPSLSKQYRVSKERVDIQIKRITIWRCNLLPWYELSWAHDSFLVVEKLFKYFTFWFFIKIIKCLRTNKAKDLNGVNSERRSYDFQRPKFEIWFLHFLWTWIWPKYFCFSPFYELIISNVPNFYNFNVLVFATKNIWLQIWRV